MTKIEYDEFLSKNEFSNILSAKNFSEENINNIRIELEALINEDYPDYINNFTIVTTGSYARREASRESDLDCFIIVDDYNKSKSLPKKLFIDIENLINNFVEKDTGTTNTFHLQSAQKFSEMVKLNHPQESNAEFTRRVLLLLEGDYLYNEEIFSSLRRMIISEYSKSNDYKFILNDFARYHRTILTDFHYKIYEGNKAWGVRSIKLKFSRRLIYISGLLAIVNTEIDNEGLDTMFSMNPLERIYYIGHKSSNEETKSIVRSIFSKYDYFLGKLSNSEWRRNMDKLERESRTSNSDYSSIDSASKEFRKACINILNIMYSKDDCVISETALII